MIKKIFWIIVSHFIYNFSYYSFHINSCIRFWRTGFLFIESGKHRLGYDADFFEASLAAAEKEDVLKAKQEAARRVADARRRELEQRRVEEAQERARNGDKSTEYSSGRRRIHKSNSNDNFNNKDTVDGCCRCLLMGMKVLSKVLDPLCMFAFPVVYLTIGLQYKWFGQPD